MDDKCGGCRSERKIQNEQPFECKAFCSPQQLDLISDGGKPGNTIARDKGDYTIKCFSAPWKMMEILFSARTARLGIISYVTMARMKCWMYTSVVITIQEYSLAVRRT